MDGEEYRFYVRGPDDDMPEERPGGTETEFETWLGRSASDNTHYMMTQTTDIMVRCERGWLEV